MAGAPSCSHLRHRKTPRRRIPRWPTPSAAATANGRRPAAHIAGSGADPAPTQPPASNIAGSRPPARIQSLWRPLPFAVQSGAVDTCWRSRATRCRRATRLQLSCCLFVVHTAGCALCRIFVCSPMVSEQFIAMFSSRGYRSGWIGGSLTVMWRKDRSARRDEIRMACACARR